jgi:hypothetical protein
MATDKLGDPERETRAAPEVKTRPNHDSAITVSDPQRFRGRAGRELDDSAPCVA